MFYSFAMLNVELFLFCSVRILLRPAANVTTAVIVVIVLVSRLFSTIQC